MSEAPLRPRDLIAVQIRVGGTVKHVGKVGKTPPNAPSGIGSRVMYKEEESQHVFCRMTNSFSIDRVALDYAVSAMGADTVAIWMPDQEALIAAPTELIMRSPASDLGERPQYRFRPTGVWRPHGRLHVGWTNRIVIVDDLFASEDDPSLYSVQEGYPSLFS